MALLAVTSQAAAQCENMRVIVRNSIWEIQGLDAFCAEFNKMKAELADMKRALSDARARNAMLEARLAAHATVGAGRETASMDSRARVARHTEE